jgi:hypothetical protein
MGQRPLLRYPLPFSSFLVYHLLSPRVGFFTGDSALASPFRQQRVEKMFTKYSKTLPPEQKNIPSSATWAAPTHCSLVRKSCNFFALWGLPESRNFPILGTFRDLISSPFLKIEEKGMSRSEAVDNVSPLWRQHKEVTLPDAGNRVSRLAHFSIIPQLWNKSCSIYQIIINLHMIHSPKKIRQSNKSKLYFNKIPQTALTKNTILFFNMSHFLGVFLKNHIDFGSVLGIDSQPLNAHNNDNFETGIPRCASIKTCSSRETL